MIIVLDPVEPAPCSFRHAQGVPLELDVTFVQQDGTPALPSAMNPQLVLTGRSQGIPSGYDLEPFDDANGVAVANVPGNFFNDRRGYSVEIYARDEDSVPTRLLAAGAASLSGGAYKSPGILGPLTVPVLEGPPGPQGEPGEQGPVGPASTVPGPEGPQGERGGTWTTGSGDPVAAGVVDGDMYLDEASGNVWRWSGTMWARR